MIRNKLHLALLACSVFALSVGTAFGAEVSAEVYRTAAEGGGPVLGKVTIRDQGDGIDVITMLEGLPEGKHGFHVHEKADCSTVFKDGKPGLAMAAGGHYDPDKTGKHLGPEGGGHKGDLPALPVGADGKADVTLHVKGLKAEEFKNRSIMIHEGGDNYSDLPAPLGGGGARLGCGILK